MDDTLITTTTILDVLRRAAADRPDAQVVRFVGDQDYTAEHLWKRSLRVGQAMAGTGLEPGARVGILVNNRVEFVSAFFGALAVGCVPVPLNTAQRGAVLAHMLDLCEISVLIVEDGFVDPIIDVVLAAEHLSTVAVVSNQTDRDALSERVTFVDFANWERHLELAVPYPSQPCDLAVLMLTSGTTGPSKAIMFAHTTGIIMAAQGCEVWDYKPEDVTYTCLPLFHGNALFCTLIGGLMAGAKVVVGQRFSATGFWKEVCEQGATKLSLLGTMHGILFRQPPSVYDRAHTVTRAALVPAPAGYYTDFEERFGLQITSFYGLTDANMTTGILPGNAETALTKPTSCGPVLRHWQVKLVDEFDVEVPVGSVGEMVVRPKLPFTTPLGYFRMPAETAALWRNCWIHTGDSFRADEDGWLYFVDRKKDALRRGGENISSQEVESVLCRFPGIVDAAAYAVPSADGEDDVAAAIQVDTSWTGDWEALLRFCYAELAFFAIPRYFRVLDALPRTENLKVRKGVLRHEGVVEDMWDRGPGGRRALEQRFATPVAP
ncbi:AMP-binding protein [Streptomyces sp. NPDC101455]|uniref:AMP-binding protein n=1 Tax=Streptomyces sp. NPDC101455 TaxID=3366142 RepID=UPI0037F3D0C0